VDEFRVDKQMNCVP